jgi:histidine phosphatase superfamily protein (branch 1)
VFARHAESTANVARVVSSNPAHPVGLTARGRVEARQLGLQLVGIDLGVAVATRFARTQQTVQLALADRNVPLLIEPGLDEIYSGGFDGAPIEVYWDWEEHHSSSDEHFPHGETVKRCCVTDAAWDACCHVPSRSPSSSCTSSRCGESSKRRADSPPFLMRALATQCLICSTTQRSGARPPASSRWRSLRDHWPSRAPSEVRTS